MTEEPSERLNAVQEFANEFPGIWKNMPGKGLFTALLVIWVCFFEFLGNSTFGYIDTHSLHGWASYAYCSTADDEHGLLIPFLVLALFWWKRKEFQGIDARPWMPAIGIIAVALVMHLAGYFSQQTRISLAAFFLGLYGLIGLTWGKRILAASFFPMCLFVFALPLGTLAETLTFPLRLLATNITATVADHALGISVVTQGTQIFGPDGKFQYEVAAACGGLRSLTAVMALCTIYAFMNMSKFRNRAILIAAGFPLAVLGNITRLLTIIIVSEAFGQEAGERVHDNTWFSLLPYVPPIIGIMLLGHILREQKSPPPVEQPMVPPDREAMVTT
jgi:exosortase